MKKVLVSTALAAVFGIFSACGDDSSSGPFNEGLSSSEELQESSSSAKDDGKSSSSKIASSSRRNVKLKRRSEFLQHPADFTLRLQRVRLRLH